MTFSKVLALASLALITGAAPGWAADWGGVKDMGGGVPVPVPAPAPVPTFDADSDWYVGLAIGANVSQSATIKDSDINMPVKDSGDIGASPIFSGSFGRYITPSLRAEVVFDYSPDERLTDKGVLVYQTTRSNFLDTNTYNVERYDTVKLSRTTGLFNLLYDIPTGTRFTPYIGGGAGFTWRKLSRNSSETATCSATADFPAQTCVSGPGLPTSQTLTASSSTNERFDFAAAVQAGIAYNITDQIVWDNGWQMLWEGGAIAVSAPSIANENRIVYKDSILQQFRSGIRIRFD
ncbi:outer membrane beta-barrel protein [Hyphomicrobium denitrificans]|uniref:outer membrane beta-barrel protein n=1 Tax=Hyphomicrobium denitrificans TaxID=53399 RepID=UPI00022E3EAE|nr:outer membrane beta-barrel protein [Hyphomicrobium denitrificans]